MFFHPVCTLRNIDFPFVYLIVMVFIQHDAIAVVETGWQTKRTHWTQARWILVPYIALNFVFFPYIYIYIYPFSGAGAPFVWRIRILLSGAKKQWSVFVWQNRWEFGMIAFLNKTNILTYTHIYPCHNPVSQERESINNSSQMKRKIAMLESQLKKNKTHQSKVSQANKILGEWHFRNGGETCIV